jgi:putative component of membrane protein insertase Oxa1/YidC/SpoIIIJ protein YidD
MKKTVTLIFLITFSMVVKSQSSKSFDLNLIEKNKSEITTSNVHRNAIHFKSTNAFVNYNPISLFFKGSLFFYQNVISKQISAQCLYDVSCSDFSKQSIQKYGLIKGVFLSADRILRCNRISALDIPASTINDSTGRCNETPDIYTFKK